MNELIKQVEQWSKDKGLDTAEPGKQMLKLVEEIGEITAGLARGNTDEIKDGIGDVKVVTTILRQQLKKRGRGNLSIGNMVALMLVYDVGVLAQRIIFEQDNEEIMEQIDMVEAGLDAFADAMDTTVEECAGLAYEEIKDRTGKLVNGTFIKDADL